MNKKYELTDNIKVVDGHVLHQIKALRSFGGVRKGELGGWIESFLNLSHSGNAWVGENAVVYDNAHVSGYAVVCDNATIYGYNRVCCGVFGSGVGVVSNGWGYLKNV